MKQSPSLETNSHSVSQEISLLSWNPKVYYRAIWWHKFWYCWWV